MKLSVILNLPFGRQFGNASPLLISMAAPTIGAAQFSRILAIKVLHEQWCHIYVVEESVGPCFYLPRTFQWRLKRNAVRTTAMGNFFPVT